MITQHRAATSLLIPSVRSSLLRWHNVSPLNHHKSYSQEPNSLFTPNLPNSESASKRHKIPAITSSISNIIHSSINDVSKLLKAQNEEYSRTQTTHQDVNTKLYRHQYHMLDQEIKDNLSMVSDKHLMLHRLLGYHASRVHPVIYTTLFRELEGNVSSALVEQLIARLVYHKQFSDLPLIFSRLTLPRLEEAVSLIIQEIHNNDDSQLGIVELIVAICRDEHMPLYVINQICQENCIELTRILNIKDSWEKIDQIENLDELNEYLRSISLKLNDIDIHIRLRIYNRLFHLRSDKVKLLESLFNDLEVFQLKGALSRILGSITCNVDEREGETIPFAKIPLKTLNTNQYDYMTLINYLDPKEIYRLHIRYQLSIGKRMKYPHLSQAFYKKLVLARYPRSFYCFLVTNHEYLDAKQISNIVFQLYMLKVYTKRSTSFDKFIARLKSDRDGDKEKTQQILLRTLMRFKIDRKKGKDLPNFHGLLRDINTNFGFTDEMVNIIIFGFGSKLFEKDWVSILDLNLTSTQTLKILRELVQRDKFDLKILDHGCYRLFQSIMKSEKDPNFVSKSKSTKQQNSAIKLKPERSYKLNSMNQQQSTSFYMKFRQLGAILADSLTDAQWILVINYLSQTIDSNYVYDRLVYCLLYRFIKEKEFKKAYNIIHQVKRSSLYLEARLLEKMVSVAPASNMKTILDAYTKRDQDPPIEYIRAIIIGVLGSSLSEVNKIKRVNAMLTRIYTFDEPKPEYVLGKRTAIILVNTLMSRAEARDTGSRRRLKWGLDIARKADVPKRFFDDWHVRIMNMRVKRSGYFGRRYDNL